MDENENQKLRLLQELQWVKYRQEMLDIIDGKLLQMREIAERVQIDNLSPEMMEDLQDQINKMAIQVKELDENSRKFVINMTL